MVWDRTREMALKMQILPKIEAKGPTENGENESK
jgi:hypothetical protein